MTNSNYSQTRQRIFVTENGSFKLVLDILENKKNPINCFFDQHLEAIHVEKACGNVSIPKDSKYQNESVPGQNFSTLRTPGELIVKNCAILRSSNNNYLIR